MNNQHSSETSRTPIVGIGASAGGLDALKGFFQSVPDDLGAAYVW
jgi:two-component system CheB/CheR fusion protein